MNLNKLAREISQREGGKQNLSIAQIKEVLKWTLALLGREMQDGGSEATVSIVRRCLGHCDKYVRKGS